MGEPGTARIDTSRPHSARVYDYLLGGKDNFQADREHGDRIIAALPSVRTAAIENRSFLRRAVTYMSNQGIGQFLDIGTGLPTANNTHQVAQRINSGARVVYVDNDPLVLAHARALLTSATPEGVTAYIHADLREPGQILAAPALGRTLDMTRPVGLMLIAVLHFITDDDLATEVLRRLFDALPAGSHVALTHGTLDFYPVDHLHRAREVLAQGPPMRLRTRVQVERLLSGLEILNPGVVSIADWRRDDSDAGGPSPEESPVYGAVARKP